MCCHVCSGPVNNQNIDYPLKTQEGIVVVHGVPADVCHRCGEFTLAIDVVKAIQKLKREIEAGNIRPGPSTQIIGEVNYVYN